MRFAHQSWVFIHIANVSGKAESMHCYNRQAGMKVQKQNEMVLNRIHSAKFGLPFGSSLPKWQDFAIPPTGERESPIWGFAGGFAEVSSGIRQGFAFGHRIGGGIDMHLATNG